MTYPTFTGGLTVGIIPAHDDSPNYKDLGLV